MTDLLWHYTTGSGLRGILETNVLWATDVRYMNDESELSYALGLVDGAFESGLDQLPEGETKAWIGMLHTKLERFQTLAVFATCFCRGPEEFGDLLAMWRAYGTKTAYSIGLAPKKMDFILPMIYKPSAQRQEIIDVMAEFHDKAAKLYPTYAPGDPRIEVHELELLSAIAVKMVRIKHRAFQEEHEYRRPLFHSLRAEPLDAIKFRDGGSLGFVPYKELGRMEFDEHPGPLPIKEIIIGPNMHPALAEEGLKLLLRKTGHDGVEVKRSQVPLRAAPPSGGS